MLTRDPAKRVKSSAAVRRLAEFGFGFLITSSLTSNDRRIPHTSPLPSLLSRSSHITATTRTVCFLDYFHMGCLYLTIGLDDPRRMSIDPPPLSYVPALQKPQDSASRVDDTEMLESLSGLNIKNFTDW